MIRVGVDHSPPFYSIESNGSVSGLAVDVFNEAARRKGLRIEWVPLQNTPLDDLIENGTVDMWPLVGATEDRRRKFHLTAPWLESDYVLLSLQSHRIRTAEEAAGQVMAHGRLRMTVVIAERFLTGSRLLVKLTRGEAIQAVCTGEAAGALVEGRVLDSILLARPAGCENARLNISALPGATTPLNIIANHSRAAEAEALRDSIDDLIESGFLARKLDEWSPFSAEGARSVWAQQEANQRNRAYGWLFALILSLSAVLAWLAWRAWNLKRVAEAAQTGMREAQRRFTAFMDNSPAIAFMKNARGRIMYVNSAWSHLLQRSPEACLGKSDFQLWPADFAKAERATDLALLDDNEPRQAVQQLPVGDETRDFLVVKFPFDGESGERFIGGFAIDVTQRQSAIRDLAESEARYRELFDNNPLPAWVCDRATLRFLMVNAAATARYGWTADEFLGGLTLRDVLSESELGSAYTDDDAIDAAHVTSGAWWHRTKDGRKLTVEVTCYEMGFEGHAARLMIVRDLTEQERTLEQLQVSEQRWQLALHGTGDGLWDWDLAKGTVFRSPRWRSMLGYAEDEVGESRADLLRLLHPEDADRVEAALAAYLARETETFTAEYRLRHRDGSWRWILDRGQAVWDDKGAPLRMVGSHTDITERKEAEEALERQARTDALTGVLNRGEFDRLLAVEFSLSQRAGGLLTIGVVDLDRFKLVNDTWGHPAGDKVLTEFGRILGSQLRATDFAGRVGGDEFAIAMPGVTARETTAALERIKEALSSVAFLAGSAVFHTTCSFGVAEMNPGHTSENQLMADADRRLYEAKESSRKHALAAA